MFSPVEPVLWRDESTGKVGGSTSRSVPRKSHTNYMQMTRVLLLLLQLALPEEGLFSSSEQEGLWREESIQREAAPPPGPGPHFEGGYKPGN